MLRRRPLAVSAGHPVDAQCPICGGPLGGFPPEDTCTGVRCLRCDYVGAVTTNPNRPVFDNVAYSIWIESDSTDRLQVYARVGNALGIGARAARSLLDAGRPVRTELQALEVKRWYHVFRELGFRIRIEPEFPWRLDTE